MYTSSIEISKSAVRNNLKFIRELVGPSVQLSCVVKGNAYGHDISQWVPILHSLQVRHFSVFSAVEAVRAKEALGKKEATIMIMGEIADWDLHWAIKNDIEFYIFDLERLAAAITVAKEMEKPARIHIEVETGMNRTGLEEAELPNLVRMINEARDHLELVGLCTHFAGAESIGNYLRIQEQKKKYFYWAQQLAKSDIKPRLKHTCCSAAAIAYPEMRMDLVRIGILHYGFWPSQEVYIQYRKNKPRQTKDPLQRALTWKSRIMSVKNVEVGQFVGYGTSYMASKNMRIGTVPVGYAYGFARSLSNQGRVLIRGKRTAVLGVVNMNMLLVDLTDISESERGDEVVLIGKQRKNTITVASFSDLSSLLNYEMLTRLPHNIPRSVVR